ncbi:MAG: oligosaccharide flippase family protein [Planctomycetaceae bacterium]|nr:oligosaccharide flippase family protein [Planctomycetaceae bacterium]
MQSLTGYRDSPRFAPDRLAGRLLRGMSRSFAASLLAAVVAFASSLLLARALGSKQFGVFTYVSSWLNIAVLFATLGIDVALIRFLPQYAAQSDWPAIRGLLRWSRWTTLGMALVVAAVLVLIGARLYLHDGSLIGLTLCSAGVSLPLLGLVAVNQGALQGFHLAGFSQVPRSVLRPLLLTLFVAVLWLANGGSVSAPTAMALNAVALAGAWWLGERWLRNAVPAAAASARPHFQGSHWLRVAVPMLLVSSMGILLHETSVIVTALISGTTIAGVYSVAVRLSRMLAFGMTAGNSMVNPLIAELHARGELRRLQLTSSVASSISLGVAVVLALALVIGSPVVLGAFGEAFQAGRGVVLILAAGQMFNAATGPVAGLLNMTGHHDRYARITVTISTLNLLGNVPGVMFWGIHGAAAVTSTLIAVQNIWAWYEVRRLLHIDSTPLGFLRVHRLTPPLDVSPVVNPVVDHPLAA